MTARIAWIAFNTFREALRERVLYNLVFFALLLVASSLLFGGISIGVERLFIINLGLTSISLIGVLIAIFLGIGLVFKEMEKQTLYTMLSRPVRRWEFIAGKFCGLAGTLVVNTFFMTVGFYAAIFYLAHRFVAADVRLLVAIYFIVLQLLMVTALALLFSTFSSPVLSAVFAFALFIAGSFAEDLRAFAAMSEVASTRWLVSFAAYLVPNFSALNVISSSAHGQPVAGVLILSNTLYALSYSGAALFAAVLVFEHRNLK